MFTTFQGQPQLSYHVGVGQKAVRFISGKGGTRAGDSSAWDCHLTFATGVTFLGAVNALVEVQTTDFKGFLSLKFSCQIWGQRSNMNVSCHNQFLRWCYVTGFFCNLFLLKNITILYRPFIVAAVFRCAISDYFARAWHPIGAAIYSARSLREQFQCSEPVTVSALDQSALLSWLLGNYLRNDKMLKRIFFILEIIWETRNVCQLIY